MNASGMTCDEARAALIDQWAGELDDRVEIRLHAHLRACTACAPEQHAMAALGGDEPPARAAIPAVLRARVLAAMRREAPRRRRGLLARPVPAYAIVVAAVVGAAAMAAIPEWRAERAETPRPSRTTAPAADGGVPFVVAESFGTCVGTPAVAPAVAAPTAAPPRRSDSL